MRGLIFVILISIIWGCLSIKKYDNVLVGEFSWDEWKSKAGTNEYIFMTYSPDTSKIIYLNQLAQKHPSIDFIIFATSYCDECKDNLPKIYKILYEAKISKNRIKLYGLDEEYEEPSGIYKNYYIESTPCLFLVRDGQTLGSVKGPNYDWLDSIIRILEKQ